MAKRIMAVRSPIDATYAVAAENLTRHTAHRAIPDQYAAGIERIERAAQRDAAFQLRVNLKLYAVEAHRPGG